MQTLKQMTEGHSVAEEASSSSSDTEEAGVQSASTVDKVECDVWKQKVQRRNTLPFILCAFCSKRGLYLRTDSAWKTKALLSL